VVAKNAELEKYREEVDSLLAALRTLQEGRRFLNVHSTWIRSPSSSSQHFSRQNNLELLGSI